MENDQSGRGDGLLKNDRTLLGGLFGFYLLCICSVLGFLGWWLARREITASANATATSAVFATQQANMTGTAVARATEQGQYEYVERFDNANGQWETGEEDSEYWTGRKVIYDQTLLWDVQDVKQAFIMWEKYESENILQDYDVYVDTRITANSGDACSGFIFRVTWEGEKNSAYYFMLCKNGMVFIEHHAKDDTWQRIATFSNQGYLQEWNRLEVQAHGAHFLFYINFRQVYDMEDDREIVGGPALAIEVNKLAPVRVYFDNFGFQPR